MSGFSQARINMVDSQIHTMGVIDQNVLNAFRTLPREAFVPSPFAAIAYGDEDMEIAPGRFMMEPVTHARLVQAVLPVEGEAALDVMGAGGYAAAILAMLTGNAVSVEPDSALLESSHKNWLNGGFSQVSSVPDVGGLGGQAFDAIVFGGAVSAIGDEWKALLTNGGRLAAIVKSAGSKIGRAILITKNENGVCGERVLFDASVPYLPGFHPKKEFSF